MLSSPPLPSPTASPPVEAPTCTGSSYGSCAAWSARLLTNHRPASSSPICSPVCSNGGDDGRNGGEHRDGGDASSFVTPRQFLEQKWFLGWRCSVSCMAPTWEDEVRFLIQIAGRKGRDG